MLVVRDSGRSHIMPGGRIEPGEDFLETLKRELLEETDWAIAQPRLLGLMHFRHLTPKPEGYRYPYPEFMQLVYQAEAGQYEPRARENEGYELGAVFKPIDNRDPAGLTACERAFQKASQVNR